MHRSLLVVTVLGGTALAQPATPTTPTQPAPPPPAPGQPIGPQPPVIAPVTSPPISSETTIPAPPPPPPAAPKDVLAAPGSLTMDRQDGTTKYGAELVYPLVKSIGRGTSISLYRLELHGQAMSGNGGVYFQLPFSVIHAGEKKMVNTADTGWGVGDLELGGIYNLRNVGRPDVGLVLHAGIVAPTGNKQDPDIYDVVDGADGNELGATVRITDLVQGIPRGLSVRIGMSPIWRSGAFFARADLGFDYNLDYDNGQNFGKDPFDPLMHFNVGGGYDGGSYQILGEVVNVFSFADLGDDPNRHPNAFTTLAFGMRFPRDTYEPYFALTLPFEEETQSYYDAVITVGLDFHR